MAAFRESSSWEGQSYDGCMDAVHELGAFLRTRRERLDPSDLGLPERRQRRTPGLRREEVAERANVSVDYVVRLEQGRGPRPSPEVLEALARALRLGEDERAYLFHLAGQSTVRRRRPAEQAPAALAGLVTGLSPRPAMLVNHRFDILTWNREMAGLMTDFAALPVAERNSMWLCILHPEFAGFYGDRERVIREGIADLRAAWAEHPDDAALADLVEELTAGSAEFASLWEQRDVRVNGRGQKPLLHPVVGSLTVEFEVLVPLQNSDQRLIIYSAADAASQAALDRIAAAVELSGAS